MKKSEGIFLLCMYIIQYIVRLKEREVCPGCCPVAVSLAVVDSESSSSDSFTNFLGKKVP